MPELVIRKHIREEISNESILDNASFPAESRDFGNSHQDDSLYGGLNEFCVDLADGDLAKAANLRSAAIVIYGKIDLIDLEELENLKDWCQKQQSIEGWPKDKNWSDLFLNFALQLMKEGKSPQDILSTPEKADAFLDNFLIDNKAILACYRHNNISQNLKEVLLAAEKVARGKILTEVYLVSDEGEKKECGSVPFDSQEQLLAIKKLATEWSLLTREDKNKIRLILSPQQTLFFTSLHERDRDILRGITTKRNDLILKLPDSEILFAKPFAGTMYYENSQRIISDSLDKVLIPIKELTFLERRTVGDVARQRMNEMIKARRRKQKDKIAQDKKTNKNKNKNLVVKKPKRKARPSDKKPGEKKTIDDFSPDVRSMLYEEIEWGTFLFDDDEK